MNDRTTIQTSMIQRNVLRRVRLIAALRAYGMIACSAILLALALWGIGREVWVARVFQNMPSLEHVSSLVRFFIVAFMDTRIIVQALTLIALAALLWFIQNAARSVRTAFHFA